MKNKYKYFSLKLGRKIESLIETLLPKENEKRDFNNEEEVKKSEFIRMMLLKALEAEEAALAPPKKTASVPKSSVAPKKTVSKQKKSLSKEKKGGDRSEIFAEMPEKFNAKYFKDIALKRFGLSRGGSTNWLTAAKKQGKIEAIEEGVWQKR